MNQFVRHRSLHLFLFPLFLVLKHFFFLVVLSSESNLLIWVGNFLISFGVCSLLYYVLYKIFSRWFDSIKAGLLSSLILLPFFFFQDFYLVLDQVLMGNIRIRWLLLTSISITTVLCYLIARARTSMHLFNEYLNFSTFFLVFYVLLTLALNFRELKPKHLTHQARPKNLSCYSCPDVYFILLDSYTSNKSLRTYFQHDNSEFNSKLREIGFKVEDESYTSYPLTDFSLAATLNLDQVKNLDQYTKQDMRKLIAASEVVKSFQNSGYKIYNLSIFNVLGLPKFYSYSYEIEPALLNNIIQHTILKEIFEHFSNHAHLYTTHQEIFSKVVEYAKQKNEGREFIYAHVLAPHTPFVIDAEGRSIKFIDQKRDKNAYVNQVKGLNKMVLKTVQEIVKQSTEAIIVIQGDHGSRLNAGEDYEKEARTVFLAYLIPEKRDTTSVINSHTIFELVFKNL